MGTWGEIIFGAALVLATSTPSGAEGTNEGQNPNTPKETAGSVGDDPVSHIEGPVIVVEPLQSVTLGEGSKDPEISPAQPS